MKINKKFGQPIDIEWRDACEVSGWKRLEDALEIPNEVICKTRGYFLGQNKEFVSVVHTIGLDERNDVCGIIHIPRGWIVKVK